MPEPKVVPAVVVPQNQMREVQEQEGVEVYYSHHSLIHVNSSHVLPFQNLCLVIYVVVVLIVVA